MVSLTPDRDRASSGELPSSKEVSKTINDTDTAALLAAAWRHVGLGVTQARLKAVAADRLELNVVTCSGDVCSTQLVAVPLRPPLRDVTDARQRVASFGLAPPLTVLLQPVALLAMIGMATLRLILHHPSEAGDQLLLLVGGRESGWWVWYAAVLAHVVETGYCAMLLTGNKLRRSCDTRGAVLWMACTLLCGFPVLRLVLKLEAMAPRKLATD